MISACNVVVFSKSSKGKYECTFLDCPSFEECGKLYDRVSFSSNVTELIALKETEAEKKLEQELQNEFFSISKISLD